LIISESLSNLILLRLTQTICTTLLNFWVNTSPQSFGESLGQAYLSYLLVLLLCKTYSNLITKAEAQVEPQFNACFLASLRWLSEGEQAVL